MTSTSILIVGCGIAGPVLATWLLQSSVDFRITIIDRATPRELSYGQNVDIRGAGASIIRKLGLDSAVRAHLTHEEGARFVDANDKIIVESAADKTGKTQTGTSDLEILRGRLAHLCYARCRAYSEDVRRKSGHGVDFIFEDSLASISQDEKKVHVILRNGGEKRSFDLLVGADGLNSFTRREAFGHEGEQARFQAIGMYGAFFSMPASETDSLWRRWYFAPRRRSIMIRPSEARDQSTVLMLLATKDHDSQHKELTALGPGEMERKKALLGDLFADAGWESERVVRNMHDAEDFYGNMIAQIKMPSWSQGRVVLLGDAGYCPSPMSGRGTTLALEGAYHLAGTLDQHIDDHRSAFAQYEATMRPIVEKAQRLPPGFPRLLHPDTTNEIWAMQRFLAAFSAIGKMTKPLFAYLSPSKAENAAPLLDYGFLDLPEHME